MSQLCRDTAASPRFMAENFAQYKVCFLLKSCNDLACLASCLRWCSAASSQEPPREPVRAANADALSLNASISPGTTCMLRARVRVPWSKFLILVFGS